jgi:hypothetical protein
MKYSFRLIETGPKAEVSNNWGHATYLLACAQCGTINLKLQTTCIMCSHALYAGKTPADNPVAASATAPAAAIEAKDLSASKESPDILKNPPAAATSPPTPDMMMANRQFGTVDEQKRLRWTWGLILLLFLLATTGLLIFSLFQSPSASSDAAKNTGKSANSVPVLAPAADAKQKAHAPDEGLALATPAPEPVQQSADTRTPTDANVIEDRIAPPAAKQDRIRTVPEIPLAPAPQQRESAAVSNARCSDAQQALALCN